MIKWFQHALRLKKDPNHYYSRFDTNLDYANFKKKNWDNQLKISFQSNKSYLSTNNFFREFYNNDIKFYVNYIVNNINKKKNFINRIR